MEPPNKLVRFGECQPSCSSQGFGQLQFPPRSAVTRYVIKFVTFCNFKAIQGTQTYGPFHSTFAILQGNMAVGKTNIIDGILFVFGEKLSRIRCKKLADVRNNLENPYGNTGCYVEVMLVQVEDTCPGIVYECTGTQMIIRRSLTNNNVSYHTMQRKRVNFKDVKEFLMANHFFVEHCQFVMLENEIYAYRNLRPSTTNMKLLKYLEDFIGTTEYKNQLRTIVNLKRKQNRLKADYKRAKSEFADYQKKLSLAKGYAFMKNKLLQMQILMLTMEIESENPQKYDPIRDDDLKNMERKLSKLKAKAEEEYEMILQKYRATHLHAMDLQILRRCTARCKVRMYNQGYYCARSHMQAKRYLLEVQRNLTSVNSQLTFTNGRPNPNALRTQLFHEAFQQIVNHTNEVFQTIAGNAVLSFEAETGPNVFRTGVIAKIRYLNFGIKPMHLSEVPPSAQTVFSIALMIGMHMYRPSALYMYDCVQTHLDEQTAYIIAKYMQKNIVHSQTILITRDWQYNLAIPHWHLDCSTD